MTPAEREAEVKRLQMQLRGRRTNDDGGSLFRDAPCSNSQRRRWPSHRGDRHCGNCNGCDCVPIGARFRGLDRTGAATGFDGGKQKLGPISKQGDPYLRRILIVGAHSVLQRAMQNPEKYPWLTQLLARRPFKVVAVALANKMARIAWALLAHGGTYRAPELVAAA
jgi:transposase